MTVRSTTRAAHKASAPAASTQREEIFKYIEAQGPCGATLEEIESALGLSGNTVRPRRQELEKDELVKDSGFTRATTSGRSAIVWVVNVKGAH